jgi:hypothetical protein
MIMNNDLFEDASTPMFVALDLRRVPPCTPEELNLFSMASRPPEI